MPPADHLSVATFDASATHKPLVRLALIAGMLPLPWFLFWTAVGGMHVPEYSAISSINSLWPFVVSLALLRMRVTGPIR